MRKEDILQEKANITFLWCSKSASGYILKRTENRIQTDICTLVFTAASFSWMHKQNITNTQNLTNTYKVLVSLKKEILTILGHGWTLKMLHHKDKQDSTCKKFLLETVLFRERWVAVQGCMKRRMGSHCIMGTEFQFCKMKRVLETNSGDGLHNEVGILNTTELYT